MGAAWESTGGVQEGSTGGNHGNRTCQQTHRSAVLMGLGSQGGSYDTTGLLIKQGHTHIVGRKYTSFCVRYTTLTKTASDRVVSCTTLRTTNKQIRSLGTLVKVGSFVCCLQVATTY